MRGLWEVSVLVIACAPHGIKFGSGDDGVPTASFLAQGSVIVHSRNIIFFGSGGICVE